MPTADEFRDAARQFRLASTHATTTGATIHRTPIGAALPGDDAVIQLITDWSAAISIDVDLGVG